MNLEILADSAQPPGTARLCILFLLVYWLQAFVDGPIVSILSHGKATIEHVFNVNRDVV